jgi:hypothetical protein
MNYVTLINRSSKTVVGTWDGRRYQITPGKHSFPEAMAVKFKEQNPVMGSQDPYSLEKDYLLGIEDHNDPITPIEQSAKPELMNRQKLDPIAQTAQVMQTNVGGLYAHERNSPLPTDGSFTKA